MRSWAWFVVVGVLCGCPGDPVEGQGTAGSDGASSTGNDDDSATISASASNTITVGSQSATDTTDSGITITSAETSDPTGDPTSATLDETGTTASDTIGESTTATDSETTTSETTGTPVCEESDETDVAPNNTEATPVVVPDIGCETSMMVEGEADGATTPDWFAYHGAYDEFTCGGQPEDYAEPRAQLDVALPLCVFATCPEVLVVQCVLGVGQNSPGGLPGCCGDGDVHLLLDCDTPNESADVVVMVDTAGAVCQPYSLTLSF